MFIANHVCKKGLETTVEDNIPTIPVQKTIYKDDDDLSEPSSESDDDSLFESTVDTKERDCRNCLTKFGNAELLASHLCK